MRRHQVADINYLMWLVVSNHHGSTTWWYQLLSGCHLVDDIIKWLLELQKSLDQKSSSGTSLLLELVFMLQWKCHYYFSLLLMITWQYFLHEDVQQYSYNLESSCYTMKRNFTVFSYIEKKKSLQSAILCQEKFYLIFEIICFHFRYEYFAVGISAAG